MRCRKVRGRWLSTQRINRFIRFRNFLEFFFGFAQPFAAEGDQFGGALYLLGQNVHGHLFAAKPVEDPFDLGHRFGIGNLFFCHIGLLFYNRFEGSVGQIHL